MFIFLYGDDVFRSSEELKSLKEKFLKENTSNASSSVFDFDEGAEVEGVKLAINMDGLFSSKKIIVVKNFISNMDKDNKDKLLEIIKKNSLTNDNLLVFWENGNPKKSDIFFKFLLEKAENHNFQKLSGSDLTSWVKEEFEKKESKIEKSALDKLINFVGDNLAQMACEIDKLSSFSNKEIIKESDIDLLVKSKIEANIFETIEAVASGNKKMALKLLNKQLDRGDDPFYILSMYVYQFRNLIKIGGFYFDGITDKNIISRETKLHPFVVQKGMQQLRNFSLGGIKNIYKKLGELDRQIKTGKISPVHALEIFIAKI